MLEDPFINPTTGYEWTVYSCFSIFLLFLSLAFAAGTVIEALWYSVMGDGSEESPVVAKLK